MKFKPQESPLFFTNTATPKKGGYLPTVAQFGDCTVEAEFLIPKGSNSGIYLQGRYEIQILDSHGKEKPVQEKVTVNGPTRAAQRKGFAAKDHIFIQGDHGPIAFRKFQVTEKDFTSPHKE